LTYAHAAVLGLVQGLTEFLPVSSSGHLILVPHFFGWQDQGLSVDAALHLGTLAALVAYFHRELIGMISGTLSRRVAILIIVATIPAGLVGLFFGSMVETNLRSPLLIAFTTAFWGVVMWIADRRAVSGAQRTGDQLEHIRWSPGIAVGVAQAISLIPGTSRSGITITTGLLAGIDRPTAARYSFLLGIPITAAAGAVKTAQLMQTGVSAGETGPLLFAVLVSFASGWLAVWFLVNYLKRRSLLPFVIYRLILAALILTVSL